MKCTVSVRFKNCFLRVPLMYQPCCLVPCCQDKLGELTKNSLQNILCSSFGLLVVLYLRLIYPRHYCSLSCGQLLTHFLDPRRPSRTTVRPTRRRRLRGLSRSGSRAAPSVGGCLAPPGPDATQTSGRIFYRMFLKNSDLNFGFSTNPHGQ